MRRLEGLAGLSEGPRLQVGVDEDVLLAQHLPADPRAAAGRAVSPDGPGVVLEVAHTAAMPPARARSLDLESRRTAPAADTTGAPGEHGDIIELVLADSEDVVASAHARKVSHLPGVRRVGHVLVAEGGGNSGGLLASGELSQVVGLPVQRDPR